MNLKYLGRSENGVFKMYPEDRQRFTDHFFNKKDGEYYLTLHKHKDIRSLEQNKYIHWAFTMIGDELQVPMEYIKAKTKLALLLVPENKVIDALVEQYEGNLAEKEKYQKSLYEIKLPPVVRDTSDLDVHEMHKFIEKLVPWAMNEFKIAVPYPNEVMI